jgi:hypothetical protein
VPGAARIIGWVDEAAQKRGGDRRSKDLNTSGTATIEKRSGQMRSVNVNRY